MFKSPVFEFNNVLIWDVKVLFTDVMLAFTFDMSDISWLLFVVILDAKLVKVELIVLTAVCIEFKLVFSVVIADEFVLIFVVLVVMLFVFVVILVLFNVLSACKSLMLEWSVVWFDFILSIWI